MEEVLACSKRVLIDISSWDSLRKLEEPIHEYLRLFYFLDFQKLWKVPQVRTVPQVKKVWKVPQVWKISSSSTSLDSSSSLETWNISASFDKMTKSQELRRMTTNFRNPKPHSFENHLFISLNIIFNILNKNQVYYAHNYNNLWAAKTHRWTSSVPWYKDSSRRSSFRRKKSRGCWTSHSSIRAVAWSTLKMTRGLALKRSGTSEPKKQWIINNKYNRTAGSDN